MFASISDLLVNVKLQEQKSNRFDTRNELQCTNIVEICDIIETIKKQFQNINTAGTNQ